MWVQSTNENTITIPPNVLKNFKVYDILEPQKNGAENSDVNFNKLKDIDYCSQDSGFQDSELNTSLFDKSRDFDLIDLYQNILVSPQHVASSNVKNASDNKVDVASDNKLDIDFKQFFDKLESGEKIDWTTNHVYIKEEASSARFDEIEEPRVLVPKVFTEPDSDSEELINEVLTQKTIERQILINSRSSKIDTKENDKLKIVIKCKSNSKQNESPILDTKTYTVNSQINNSFTFDVLAVKKDEKIYKKKRLIKPEAQKAKFTKGPGFYEKSIILPQIMARINARLAYLDEKCQQTKRLSLDAGGKAFGKTECRISNLAEETKREVASHSDGDLGSSPVKSKMKNSKLCMNRSTQSIAVHNTVKTCTNCNDASFSNKAKSSSVGAADYGKLSPVVLMEDCNRERLKDLKRSQMFRNFVLNGKY